MKTFIFLNLLFLASCSEEEIVINHSIDPMLQPHVNMFLDEAESHGQILSPAPFSVIYKSLLKNDSIDISGMANKKTRIVYIDSASARYKASPEALVFHELGHLLLSKTHEDQFVLLKVPFVFSGDTTYIQVFTVKSIMHSSAIANFYRSGLREYYIDELFKQGE